MADRRGVQVAELRHREFGRRERETEVRVRELPAQALAGGQEDRLVVEGERGELVQGMPAGVTGELGVGIAPHEPEERGRELPYLGVPRRLAARLQLFQVGHLAHVHLGRQVTAHRLLQRLVRLEDAAGECPGARVRLARPLPQKRLEPPVPHLEDGCEHRMGRCFRLGVVNRVHSPIGYRL